MDLRTEFSVLEWLEPEGAKAEELRATWARFQISVQGRVATRVISGTSKSSRNHLYLPVYPLAEWLVSNWWFIFYEYKTQSRKDYPLRHALRYAGEGFALPDLQINPLGDSVEFAVNRRVLGQQQTEFIDGFTSLAPKDEAQDAIVRFIREVVQRLNDVGVADTRLHEEWREIEDALRNPEEASFCKVYSALGQDPFDVDPALASAIEAWSRKLDEVALSELFVSSDGPHAEDSLNWLGGVVDQMDRSAIAWKRLPMIRQEFHRTIGKREAFMPPWELGYRVADDLRAHLKLNGTRFASLPQLFEVLGCTDAEQGLVHIEPDPKASVDGVARLDATGQPFFATSRLDHRSRKFALCRSLFDYLGMGEDSVRVSTKTHSARQQASRAFAAEFLAPSDLLSARVQDDVLDLEQVKSLADEFGVSEMVVQHQLENHGIACVLT
jgi:hypothetical protein